MIRLNRDRSPAAIHENFHGSNRLKFEKELMEERRSIFQGSEDKHNFKPSRWKKAKAQLLKETGGKCAYCEAPTSVVAFGDVEHFRPKSIYWWLAYCYENYLASCALCNQAFKKDKFPCKNSRTRGPNIRSNTTDSFIASKVGLITPDPFDAAAIDSFAQLHEQERPLLLNPYIDDPEPFFAWRADDALQEVELIPRPGNPEAADFCQAAVKFYGLNRPQLKIQRYKTFRILRVFRLVLDDPGISPQTRSETRQVIEDMKRPDQRFAAMVRFFDAA